jgi:hypothetical protein
MQAEAHKFTHPGLDYMDRRSTLSEANRRRPSKFFAQEDSTLAIDQAYIDYAQFQRFTDEGVCYVTKMKKTLKYSVIYSVTYVNEQGLVAAKEEV